MISAKRLAQMVKKWQSIAALTQKRLTSTPSEQIERLGGPSTSVADKDHCILYSADGRRFEVPLAYLGTSVFGELLRQSQEEFRFSSEDDRITLPCETTVMEFMTCLLRRDASEEIERALLSSMVTPCNYGNNGFVRAMGSSQQLLVSCF